MSAGPPPTIRKQGAVKVAGADGSRVAGYYGHVPERESLGFVSERDSHHHRIRALDAYAISTEALGILGDLDASVVLIAETDTGDVYEFMLSDFTEWGEPVPDQFLEIASDPQRYHQRSDPVERWPNHLSDLYRHDESPEGTEFKPASEVE